MKRFRLAVIMFSFAVLGVVTLLLSSAQTAEQHMVAEAELATLSGAVEAVNDSTASGGRFIQFGVEAEPPASTRPDATTTGHDGNLTRTFGAVTINQAWLDTNNGGSRVVENVNFTGQVTVTVNDLTIRNFKITGGSYGVYNNVFTGNPSTGLVLEDGEITGQDSSGIAVSNTIARRLHIHHQGSDAIKPFRNVLIESCYIHHLGSNVGSHADGVQMVNGQNVTVRGCNFEMKHDEPGYNNSQVFIIQTNIGTVDNIIIDANWINGGGYSVQINDAQSGYGYPTNVQLTNNRFGRDYQFGPTRFGGGTPAVVSGNVWDDTGEPL